MLRFFATLIVIGAAAALGIWMLDEGLVTKLLKLLVAVVLLIGIGAVPLVLLNKLSAVASDEDKSKESAG